MARILVNGGTFFWADSTGQGGSPFTTLWFAWNRPPQKEGVGGLSDIPGVSNQIAITDTTVVSTNPKDTRALVAALETAMLNFFVAHNMADSTDVVILYGVV